MCVCVCVSFYPEVKYFVQCLKERKRERERERGREGGGAAARPASAPRTCSGAP